MMVSETEYKANPSQYQVKNYDGHMIYMKTSHVGLVLDTYERNGYHDSDFYARVWSEEKQCIESIEYATTRGWTYPNFAIVDATEEVKAKALAYEERKLTEARKAHQAELDRMPTIGAKIRVIKGRKLPVGTIAEVFWFGKDSYKSSSRYSNSYSAFLPFKYDADLYRIGLRLIDGSRVFVSAANVEKV